MTVDEIRAQALSRAFTAFASFADGDCIAWAGFKEAVRVYEQEMIRPISEAPDDGTQILTFDPTSPVAWCQDFWIDEVTITPGWAMNPDSSPTHFRPLPPEPFP